MSQDRSRSRSPVAAPAASVPWWQKFKPVTAIETSQPPQNASSVPSTASASDAGSTSNPWMNKPKNPWANSTTNLFGTASNSAAPLGTAPGSFSMNANQVSQPQVFQLAQHLETAQPEDKWGYPGARPGMNRPQLPSVMPPAPPSGPLTPVNQHHSILLNKVPSQLNNLNALFTTFSLYGDILSVAPSFESDSQKALIEFKEKFAVDKILSSVKPMGWMDVEMSYSNLSAKKQPVSNQPPQGQTNLPASEKGNLILESDEVRKRREKREQLLETIQKKRDTITTMTEQCKGLMTRITQLEKQKKTVENPEELDKKIAAFKKLLSAYREKMTATTKEIESYMYKKEEKQARLEREKWRVYQREVMKYSEERQKELTLDLRPKNIRITGLPVELRNGAVIGEYLKVMEIKGLKRILWKRSDTESEREEGVLAFENHDFAEKLLSHELAFKAEWIENDSADSLDSDQYEEEELDLEGVDEEPNAGDEPASEQEGIDALAITSS
jgi:hypothetical protein